MKDKMDIIAPKIPIQILERRICIHSEDKNGETRTFATPDVLQYFDGEKWVDIPRTIVVEHQYPNREKR